MTGGPAGPGQEQPRVREGAVGLEGRDLLSQKHLSGTSRP